MNLMRKLVLSFAGTILIGTLLLWLPVSVEGHVERSFVNAFFTATSAVCVTGLSVLDTGKDFTLFGQMVILILIQVGGLGILTFSNLMLLAGRKRLGLSDRIIIEQTHGLASHLRPSALVRKILAYTLAIETIGGLVLYTRFQTQFSPSEAVWQSVFHAVSAYCNAGFGLFSNSFMDYREDILVNTTLMALIVLGGLGFVVFADVLGFLKSLLKRNESRRLSFNSRVVLRTTAFLIVAGTLAVWGIEAMGTFEGRPWREALLPSLFLSVTARTAGFNTIDTGHLTNATLLLLIGLMAIGASPGSTGGGLKTTTFAILCSLLFSRSRNRPDIEIMERRIPMELVAKSLATFAGFLIAIFVGALLLQITEHAGVPHDTMRTHFLDHLFELVSALGTVGLSTGLTPNLSVGGKVVIGGCMFIGRLGPLTIAASVIGRRPRIPYRLPPGSIMVG